MLINYLQQTIHILSEFNIDLFNYKIPVTVLLALIILVVFIVVFRKVITLKKIYAWIAVVAMVIIGYNSVDYYMNLTFYEIQQNWHYIAYALFVLMNYRVLRAQQAPDHKIIWNTWLSGFFISALDEFLQVFLTRRIFDPCDIAKDLWGIDIGLVILFFVILNGDILKHGWKFRHQSVKEYFNHPMTSFFLVIVFTYIFLIISSVLTESRYLIILTTIVIACCALFFIVLHLSQKKITGKIIIGLLISGLIISGVSHYKNFSKNITSNSYCLTVYEGIPIPYFDVMVFPDGRFRLVDKKLDFNNVDRQLIFRKNPDVLLIGTGIKGNGGEGIGESKDVQFIYNPDFNKGLQVIKLKTPEACKIFNRLKESGFKVLFIINNT